ncbi:hypothetical protein ACTFIZ_004417 [Dictyostelium cf. discoideum]
MSATFNDISFRHLFFLASLGICLAIIVAVMIGFFLYGFIKYVKKGLSKKDGARYGGYLAWEVFWVGTPLLVLMASAFNQIHWALAWVLMVIILQSGFMNIMKRSPDYKNDLKFKGKIDNYFRSLINGLSKFGKRNSILVFFAFVIASFISSFMMYDLCIGIHPFRVSSRYSRKSLGDSCPSGEICNFILTVPENLSNSIIVGWHSNDEPIGSFAYYDTISHSDYFKDSLVIKVEDFKNPYNFSVNGTYFEMDNIKQEEQRYVSWADITGLTSSTVYYIVVGIEKSDGELIFYPERKFRTAPSDGTPYNFITGGDMGMTGTGESLSINAAMVEPLFVMLGGDVAYDSGFDSCYRCWDEWFNRWDTTFITPLGFSLPIITTIGNHEAGGWKSSRGSVQFYTSYLPFQLGLQNIAPNDRPLQHSHTIGNETIIIVMDSWVVDQIPDQVSWMEQVLSDNNNKTFKFALYHIALYPCTKISMDVEISSLAKEFWGPVFDKYNLTVGYENHYHLYKRSKQLVNGLEHPNGTLYIGDGSWGVETTMKLRDYDYLEVYGRIQHVIHSMVNSHNSTVNIETINIDNEIFDSWERKLK